MEIDLKQCIEKKIEEEVGKQLNQKTATYKHVKNKMLNQRNKQKKK